MSAVTTSQLQEIFAQQGHINPIRALTEQACQQFLDRIDRERQHPLGWGKGYAASSWAFYEIATNPSLLDALELVLGKNIMLWGATMVDRPPQVVHPWHTDMESWTESGKTVAVWIGLQNAGRDSSLKLVSRSHRFGATIQQLRQDFNVGRDALSDDQVLDWARARDGNSKLVQPDVRNGEALIFDGKLWHGSHNRSNKERRALLLQYATPATVIRMPDLNYLDWPFRQLDEPRPPCLIVRGKDNAGVNRIVDKPNAPHDCPSERLANRIYPLSLPLPMDSNEDWKPQFIFNGSTLNVDHRTCHASNLVPGHCPHPPHRHDEEELVVVLYGELEVILPDLAMQQRMRLKRGDFVYYPRNFFHTLEAVGETPANYLCLKWHAGSSEGTAPSELPFGQFCAHETINDEVHQINEGFSVQLVFEGPTAYLQKLHCHRSALRPGAGYDPHVDDHDVAIVILSGEVETLGELAKAPSVIFYPAGELHGMRNSGDSVARYLVFEFHGRNRGAEQPPPKSESRSFLSKLKDPACWKRKFKSLKQQLAESRA